MMKRGSQLRRRNQESPRVLREGTTAQIADTGLVDRLTDTIRNLTANRELLNTRISVLNGEGMKTASILELGGMYRSLVTQVAVMYETDDFQNIVAPFIEKRFEELGKPSLIPGTIGSYIFGCYLSDYGLSSLNKFCTPICAASIRVPNKNSMSMRCTEKVIWTDGGETPLFILVEDDPTTSTNGKVFIPWIGDASSFRGLTQGAIDEISSFGVENVEIFGQLFNNQYIELLSFRSVKEIAIVERIRIRPVDYVNNKNGGIAAEKVHKVPLANTPSKDGEIKPENGTSASGESSEDGKMEKKNFLTNPLTWFLGVVVVFFGIMIFLNREIIFGKKKTPVKTVSSNV